MQRRRFLGLMLMLGVGALTSCQKPRGNRKHTEKVKGRITVDGTVPGSAVRVECHSTNSAASPDFTVSQTMTNPDGSFEISTYESGDGVPPGEYVLTFYWGELNAISMNYGGPDRLNSRYSDPQKSEIKLTVKEGEPIDLKEIPLTTK